MKTTTVPHLPDWIPTLSPRGISITIRDNTPHLTGPATDEDHRLARIYAHALTIAAAHTHECWWNHQLGRTDLTNPDDIPWTCATCGTPDIDILDSDLICWCHTHRRHANTTPWEAVGWKAV